MRANWCRVLPSSSELPADVQRARPGRSEQLTVPGAAALRRSNDGWRSAVTTVVSPIVYSRVSHRFPVEATSRLDSGLTDQAVLFSLRTRLHPVNSQLDCPFSTPA